MPARRIQISVSLRQSSRCEGRSESRSQPEPDGVMKPGAFCEVCELKATPPSPSACSPQTRELNRKRKRYVARVVRSRLQCGLYYKANMLICFKLYRLAKRLFEPKIKEVRTAREICINVSFTHRYLHQISLG